jgi:hypothetical protein
MSDIKATLKDGRHLTVHAIVVMNDQGGSVQIGASEVALIERTITDVSQPVPKTIESASMTAAPTFVSTQGDKVVAEPLPLGGSEPTSDPSAGNP